MITDIPTAEEFKEAGVNLLFLAWEIAADLVRWSDEDFSGAYLDEEMRAEYWQKSQPALGNAYSLIEQAMELGLKSRIAAVSPYILIAQEHSKWGDKPFSDFRTIDATDLIRVHNAVSPATLSGEFQAFFDEVRRTRNRLMHSVPRDTFDARTLFVNVLQAAEALFGDTPWLQICLGKVSDSRDSVLDGGEHVRDRVVGEARMALGHLRPAEARRFLGIDKDRRSYVCPACYNAAEFRDNFPALAQLATKTKGETRLDCIVCGVRSAVTRAPCPQQNCEGNVIDEEGTCLTCIG